MQVSVTGRHLDITDSLRDYTAEKINKLKRHFDHVIDVHVVLGVAKLEHKAEATVQIDGAKLFAEDVHSDMYHAIDNVASKLDRQIIKHKEKTHSHRQH